MALRTYIYRCLRPILCSYRAAAFHMILGHARAILCVVIWAWTGIAGMTLPAPAAEAPRLIEHAFTVTPRRPLLAHMRFCLLYQGQCDAYPDRRAPTKRKTERKAEALAVNLSVNQSIRPVPDRGFDSWDIDVSEGDCEDYALQKRADLLAQGWPSAALRLAIVRTRHDVPHVVLLVRIGAVDYALDNLHARILPWDETDYSFLMLQDHTDPRAWHDLSDMR